MVNKVYISLSLYQKPCSDVVIITKLVSGTGERSRKLQCFDIIFHRGDVLKTSLLPLNFSQNENFSGPNCVDCVNVMRYKILIFIHLLT